MSNTALFTNNASTVLAAAVSTTSQTTFTVTSGTGGLFPSPGSGQFFSITLTPLSAPNGPPWEIVYCTARTGDVLTVVRGQEGTTPTTWSVGDNVQLLLTAGVVTGFSQSSQVRPNIQAFTSSGTFTVPSGVTQVKVTVIGGGGGGASSSTSNPGGGGGAGGIAVGVVSGLSGTVAVTVGAGGAGGASGGANSGADGGTSSFGSYLSATGGGGGNAPVSDGGAGAGGGVGTVGSGATGYGTGGSSGTDGSSASGKGGDGGAPGNGRGITDNVSCAPANAVGYGGGGGGCGNGAGEGSGYPGGAGAGGLVVVEWYIPA